ncbi:DUF642 domain-containing protein [Arsukibacterium sp.]|uniref:DUF642 domain-containing protein n=1 Tax=Arsukibacterium sp. TaxID=1977258 RepID=UPI00299E4A2F|nr:DUF642 domain-containing protein [Arsukibacterium sp.]MDX1537754.1 DUF642 domain-containing protein [Arsukibacterium sp.]
MSFTPVRTLLAAAALLGASFSSHATLIVNGDFEENFVASNDWAAFSSDAVAGWQGSNIEIWNALNGVLAVSGNNFIELNAHGSNTGAWSIFQTIATEVGRKYELSFYYRARQNSNEVFDVSFARLSHTIDNHTKAGWSFFSSIFTATSDSSVLGFTSRNTGTMGNLIDKVQLTAVPEPASLAVFGAGLLALVGGRRLRGNKAKAN